MALTRSMVIQVIIGLFATFSILYILLQLQRHESEIGSVSSHIDEVEHEVNTIQSEVEDMRQ